MMKHAILVMIALGLLPSAVTSAADAGGSELDLARDFRLGAMRQLPRPASGPWRVEQRDYAAENAVEWQVELEAPAGAEPPVYDDVQSADFVVRFPVDGEVTLHWSRGSHAEPRDFQPRQESLVPGQPSRWESYGGRSSDGVLPYFNLATAGGGLIAAIGWPGDWRAAFETLPGGRVRITAGLKHAGRLALRARERLRLPAMLVMGYRGTWLDGQNQFRRLLLRRFTPPNHSPLDLMPVAASVHGMYAFNATTEEKLAGLAAELGGVKLPLDTFWLDAGWNAGGFPRGQGNPLADAARYPRGLAPVGVAARQAGMRLLAWFEPERAMRGTWLDREHPDWLLMPSGTPRELHYMETDGFRLLDLGNPTARRWALDSVSQAIRAAGIAVYRQDFNLYPAYFWHTTPQPAEAARREVLYVNGLYDFLDELVRRHPGLILDNCASGGRRLDFEMLRRCVVLWRSDSCWGAETFPRNVQAMTHGLSHWLPLHGLGAHTTDAVALRSGMGACASYAINYRDPAAVAALRQHLEPYLKVRPLFAADFHPLTDWSLDPAQWIAFQFHDPAREAGLVQAFCGAAAGSVTLKLRGLDPRRSYTILNWDHPSAALPRSGRELGAEGLEVRGTGVNRAVVLQYAAVSGTE